MLSLCADLSDVHRCSGACTGETAGLYGVSTAGWGGRLDDSGRGAASPKIMVAGMCNGDFLRGPFMARLEASGSSSWGERTEPLYLRRAGAGLRSLRGRSRVVAQASPVQWRVTSTDRTPWTAPTAL